MTVAVFCVNLADVDKQDFGHRFLGGVPAILAFKFQHLAPAATRDHLISPVRVADSDASSLTRQRNPLTDHMAVFPWKLVERRNAANLIFGGKFERKIAGQYVAGAFDEMIAQLGEAQLAVECAAPGGLIVALLKPIDFVAVREHIAVTESPIGVLVLEKVVVQSALRHRPVAGIAGDFAEGKVEAEPIGNGAALVTLEYDAAFFQDTTGRVDIAAGDEILPAFFNTGKIDGVLRDLIQ